MVVIGREGRGRGAFKCCAARRRRRRCRRRRRRRRSSSFVVVVRRPTDDRSIACPLHDRPSLFSSFSHFPLDLYTTHAPHIFDDLRRCARASNKQGEEKKQNTFMAAFAAPPGHPAHNQIMALCALVDAPVAIKAPDAGLKVRLNRKGQGGQKSSRLPLSLLSLLLSPPLSSSLTGALDRPLNDNNTGAHAHDRRGSAHHGHGRHLPPRCVLGDRG
jgi:hypothetical protein